MSLQSLLQCHQLLVLDLCIVSAFTDFVVYSFINGCINCWHHFGLSYQQPDKQLYPVVPVYVLLFTKGCFTRVLRSAHRSKCTVLLGYVCAGCQGTLHSLMNETTWTSPSRSWEAISHSPDSIGMVCLKMVSSWCPIDLVMHFTWSHTDMLLSHTDMVFLHSHTQTCYFHTRTWYFYIVTHRHATFTHGHGIFT